MTDKMEALWELYESTSMRYARELLSICRNIHSLPAVSSAEGKSPAKDEVILRLREVRDLRREFMAACGECDDAYINQKEAKVLRETEFFFDAAATLLDISDEEIDAAQLPLPYTTSLGRKTATPQFPTRFDM